MRARTGRGREDAAMARMDFALLVLRVAIGVTIAVHGWNKVRNGIAGTARWFHSMGMRPGTVNAWMAAGTELGGGGLFALGLLTPLAAAAIIGLMLVAGWTSHRAQGFFVFRPGQGWEYVFVLAVVAFAVATIGPGRWSLDNAIGIGTDGYLDSWWGSIVAAVVGLGGGAAQMAVFYRPPAPEPAA
jgi:putative oxidoreductase